MAVFCNVASEAGLARREEEPSDPRRSRGARSRSKFVVSRAGEAYDARIKRKFSMKKFGITVTAFFLLLGALALASAERSVTKNTILVNRIGPSGGELFIANGDGSGERKLNSGGNMDYDAMFSNDGKWIVFTSERGTDFKRHKFPLQDISPGFEHIQAASIYVIQSDGTGLRKLTPEGEMAGSPKWSADGKRVVFYDLDAEYTFAARLFGEATSQIVSVDVSTGVRTVNTSGPGLKVSPQFLSAYRIAYLIKGTG